MIAVTGGGTGGHIFPVFALIEELSRRGHRDIVWIGSKAGIERGWAEKAGVRYRGIATGKLRRYFSLRNLTDPFKVVIGLLESFFFFLGKRPQVLFSKGGFVSVPPVLAARLLGIPVVTHESDTVPGLATRIISRGASAICVGFSHTRDAFEGKNVVWTGNPVRSDVLDGDGDRGRSFLGFWDDLPMVFVVGGSLGARILNETVWALCGETNGFNIVHQCGRGNKKTGMDENRHYRQIEFLEDRMGDVLDAATVVVSRAGAGALYEIASLGKASILIPLPLSASRGEQIENARYFEAHGASVVIANENLTPHALEEAIQSLLADGPRLETMGREAKKLVRKDAASAIAKILEGYLKRKQ
ncbi:MAG: undecaprenyldiphospho-muramoylpentapeptide beta-N-acetylglucosaminyltransferase [Spirochaetes bacterium]|nr:undecaprenyldiphospho-muramoylpentapeptide beta-N-acetylglucosaminyltransferase [Spirochaetota bacterium]